MTDEESDADRGGQHGEASGPIESSARLKSSHQTTIAASAANEFIMPTAKPAKSGTTAFTPTRNISSSAAAAMPGHSRSGVPAACPSV